MATFTASRLQIATYLLGICPFSIAFLVFLNSSVSFVITDIVRKEHGVGNAVGSLGFADELLALFACPLWGLLSDRIGVRMVCVIGYLIIGIALIVFVQARNVYPQLLFGRLLFSVGGAAASTMVTAVLPTMSQPTQLAGQVAPGPLRPHGRAPAASITSELTITPVRFRDAAQQKPGPGTESNQPGSGAASSRVAGFVGMFTGFGALLALVLFLPLPARFQGYHVSPSQSLRYSYYIVAVVAFVIAVVCFFGLRSLQSEKKTEAEYSTDPNSAGKSLARSVRESSKLLYQALFLGFRRADIGVSYVGGFVARASSVGISLFVPLLVNAAFLSAGSCLPEGAPDTPAGLPDIKRQCPRAYIVASELTGVSQLVALICAPLFGYWSSRVNHKSLPLMFAACAGIVGYPLFVKHFDPDDQKTQARVVAFLGVCLIGVSQIGAIVCSLGILSTGVLAQTQNQQQSQERLQEAAGHDSTARDTEPLLASANTSNMPSASSLAEMKGSIAGIYSFWGGAAILILTKAGGSLFDSVSTGAPFYMMAVFNAILLVICVILSLRRFLTA